MELTALSLSEASALLLKKQISPVELTRAHLERIGRLDGKINSFITLTPDKALQSARQAEQAFQQGLYRSPLQGIPLALKDLYETQGIRTSAGSKVLGDYVPQEDAVAVQKLAASGAVLLGKLNMHEIALGVTTVNPHFGPCHNPWNLDRVTGGSSGGSAAALATEFCMGSLGTDTGGSIRIPSSLCGVVGLKPTFGRISLRGVIPLSWNLDHAGPMARRVADVALLLQAVAGYDPQDPYSADIPIDDYLAHLESGANHGWRVALASGAYFNKADPEVLAAIQAAADVFKSLGAQVQPVEIPNIHEAAAANSLMTQSDAAAFHRDRLQAQPADFGADVLTRLQTGAAFTSTQYILARRTQSLVRWQLELFFRDVDLLLTPTTPVPAPPIQGPDAIEQARLLTRFTAPFNLTGLPAISLPCGFTSSGLPIGLQIVARPWAEAVLLQAAHAYEQATEWHLRRPAIRV